MKKLRWLCSGILFCLVFCIISGCGNSVSTEDIAKVFESKDTKQIAEVIATYQEQNNKEELDKAVVEQYKMLSESKDYQDFVFMENLAGQIQDEHLQTELKGVLDENFENKVVAFTTGEWVRRDYTNLDGMVIDLKWADNDGTALVTGAKVKNNVDNFKDNDVKWKNTKAISEDELSYEDLWKSNGEPSYEQAVAKIDFDQGIMVCHVTGNDEEYSKGLTQVWIQKNRIDTGKETITNDDFRSDDREFIESVDTHFTFSYDNDLIEDEELRKQTINQLDKDPTKEVSSLLARIDKDNITREMVIDQFSYGHIMYQDPNDDIAYDAASHIKNNIDCKAGQALIEQSDYAVIYDSKKNDKHIKMYFDSGGKLLIAFFYPNDLLAP